MSLLKIITPDAQDFGEPTTQLIKVSSRGLHGADRQQFVKRASAALASRLDSLLERQHPDEPLIHLLAVGSTEQYGSNRNGDGFRKQACQAYHPTFVKHAKVYRDHCFPAGTSVLMADRTRRPIEQLAVGDMVTTLVGHRPVTTIMRQEYIGPAARFRLRGEYQPLVATYAHPMYVLRRSQVHCRHKYSRLTAVGSNTHAEHCPEFRDGFTGMTPEYVAAGELTVGDYLLLPQPQHGTTNVSQEFASLVGWVASEGFVSDAGLIQFTFSEANTADIIAVKTCLERNQLHVSVTERPQYHAVMLTAYSPAMRDMIRQYVVGTLADKRITAAVLDWARPSLLSLLTAHINGDGHVSKKHYHAGQLRIRSSSPQMLRGLADIVRALGAPATLQWDVLPGNMLSPTNGQLYAHSGSGVVTVDSGHSQELIMDSRKTFVRNRRRAASGRLLDGLFPLRIDRVLVQELAASVYNLEVAGPHHYVAGEVVVHNCNKNPAKSYGRVVDSWFNDRMGRIELVCGLNATEKTAKANGGLVADREMEKLAQGREIPVSMACRVQYDTCSHCGNKAPTKEDYCAGTDQGGHCKAGGLRDRIGQLVELDGGVHQLHADNPHPCFFDISHVIRPADRIAYVSGLLEKAAADKRMVKSAELAAAVQVGLPLSVQLEDAPTAVAPLIKLAYACLDAAAADTDLLWSLPEPAAATVVSHPDFRHKAAQCFRALSDRRICLPLPQFLQLVTGQPQEKTAVLTNAAAAYLGGAFDRLTADPNLVQRLVASPYCPAAAAAPALEKWANDLAAQFSYEPHFLIQRSQLAAIQRPVLRAPLGVKTANDRTPAARLAEEYALYQLAYLGALPKSDLPLTVSLLKLQNDAVATCS